MQLDEIKKIMKENMEVFEALEEYDKTHELPIGRARIDITLSKRLINKLKEEKKKSGKPISRIIEEALHSIIN